jgi:hypothetical protein
MTILLPSAFSEEGYALGYASLTSPLPTDRAEPTRLVVLPVLHDAICNGCLYREIFNMLLTVRGTFVPPFSLEVTHRRNADYGPLR